MEIRNDNFNINKKGIGIRFTGKGINDIYNENNIYNSNGIGIQLINNQNNNREIAFIDTSNIDNNNYSKLKINFNNDFINLRNLNENNQILSLNFNNNLIINNNVGIGSTIPKSLLDVSGRISCYDINIGGIILNKDYLVNVTSSINNITSGILKVDFGGTGVSSLNNEQLLVGKFQQSPYLIWKNTNRRLGIGLTNPLYNLDVNGGVNAFSYKILGNDINNIFLKPNDLINSSNDCFINTSNATIINANNYTDIVSTDLINKFNSKNSDWTINGNDIVYSYSKIGIGTDTPLTSLHVIGDINYTGNLRKNGVIFRSFSGNYNDLTNLPKLTWEFNDGHIYNLNDANIGIGSKNPISKLDVNGDINYSGDIRSNGKIVNIFSGNYNDLTNIPSFSKVAFSGNFNDIYEVPPLFSGNYNDLLNIPAFFPSDWKSTISNIPTYFPADWNISVKNKPQYFRTSWNMIDNKPITFNTNWYSNIYGKPDYFPSDWNMIVNKPSLFYSDWNSNIINKPEFAKVAFTGQYSNLLNKPAIFSGYYKDLREKPRYASVAFSGNYKHLSNLPNLFSGSYNDLSNKPINFQTDWNTTILNIPTFANVAFTGLYNDLINAPIDNWGENGNHIYNCNIGNIGIGSTNPAYKLDIRGSFNVNNAFRIDGTLSEIKVLSDIYFSNNIFINNTNINNVFATSNDFFRTSNWIMNGNNIYNVNSGCVGINTTNPSSSYKLDVNGNINSTGYNITGNGGLFWSSFGNAGISCASFNGEYSSSSIIGDMIIRSQEGKRIILQNGTNNAGLFIYNNKIGIGTNNPSSILHLHDNSSISEIKILLTDAYTGTTATDGFSIFKSGTEDGYIWNYENNAIRFGISNLERMCILNNGNIGIGTNNPSSLLHLHNSISNGEIKMLLTDASTGTTSNDGFSIFKSGINEGYIWNYENNAIRFGTSNVERMCILNNGNIGFGTNNPSSLLHLHNMDLSGEIKILLTDASTGITANDGFSIFKSGTEDGYIWNYENNAIRFGISNVERMCILNNGNIGIGTNNPLSILHLNNSFPNSEIKILLTDGSTGTTATDGFSIFKSGINEGYIWNYENNAIRFGTYNVERMCILNNGNIGIGTTNPSSLLHLHNMNLSAEIKILLTDGSTGITANDGFSIFKSGIDEGYIWNYENNAIRFGTSNIERMCILNNGNIGIGTNNPSSILHLHNSSSNGEIKILLTDALTGTTSNDGFSIFKSGINEGYIWNYENNAIRFGTSNIERMCILDNGNIGIGTNNPSSLLHLHNSTSEIKILLTDSSTINGFSIFKSGINEGYIWNYENNALRFGTNNIERMCILNNGNIGIGTTNPSSLLHLHNSNISSEVKILLTDASTGNTLNNGFSIFKSGSKDVYIWNYENNAIRFGTLNVERMCILNNGNIGIGTNNPIYNLDVNGTINATSFRGDGSLINNLNINNISSIFQVSNGGTGLSNLVNGQLLIGNGTNNILQTSNLFWDNTNNRLGIGSTIPRYTLDINGYLNASELYINGNSFNGSSKWNYVTGTNNIYYNNGSVGIGLTNPSNIYKLQIQGDVKVQGNITADYININNDIYLNNLISSKDITATNFIGYLDGNAKTATNISASGITNQDGIWKSVNRPGPYKMYINNSDTNYSIQLSLSNQYQFYLKTYSGNNEFGYLNVEYANYTKNVDSSANVNINSLFINGLQDYMINEVQYINGTSYYISFDYAIANQTLPLGKKLSLRVEGDSAFYGVIYVTSDNRIKINIKNLSNSLDKLLLLKPVSYDYIDKIRNNKNNNGFIAQDVQKIIPEAISYSKEFIPNIYKIFDINDDIIETNEDLTLLLNVDDIIQIINKENKKEEFKIIEISSKHIKIDKKYEYEKCFIYGKKVDDYHTINYNYIYNLHISATQELYLKIQEYDKIIKEREIKLKEQQEKIDLLFELLRKK